MSKIIIRIFIVILFSGLSRGVHATESVDSTRYNYAKKAPQNLTLVSLVTYLKRGAINNQKIVETFFYWIATHIEYDRELML